MASTFRTEELYNTLTRATAETEPDSEEYTEITAVRRAVYRAVRNGEKEYTVSGTEKNDLRQAVIKAFSYICANKDERYVHVSGELEDIAVQIDEDDLEEYKKNMEEQDRLAMEEWQDEWEYARERCCKWWICDGTCPNFDPSWCV